MPINSSSYPFLAPSSGSLRGRQSWTLQAIHEHRAVKPHVRWAFYLFVASLPFEPINLVGSLDVAMITGAVLVLSTILQLPLFYRLPSGAFWCFGAFLYICVVMSVLEDDKYWAELSWEFVSLFQAVIIGWISYNLMRYDRIARAALLAFASSCVVLAALQVLGIAATTSHIGAKFERITTLGANPNSVARTFAIGLLVLIGFSYGHKKTVRWPRILAWPIFALFAIGIVQTGSRGGILALGAGLLTFALTGGSLKSKVRNAFVVLFAIGFLSLMTYQLEATRLRFERSLEEGNLARREQIYPTAWQMFLEKPLFGWGQVSSDYELGTRLGNPEEPRKNPHNMILQLLVVNGIFGAIPMFLGTWLAVLTAWKARRGTHGILPIAMITTLLVANMSGSWYFNEAHWVIIAYALASGSYRVTDGVVGHGSRLMKQVWPRVHWDAIRNATEMPATARREIPRH